MAEISQVSLGNFGLIQQNAWASLQGIFHPIPSSLAKFVPKLLGVFGGWIYLKIPFDSRNEPDFPGKIGISLENFGLAEQTARAGAALGSQQGKAPGAVPGRDGADVESRENPRDTGARQDKSAKINRWGFPKGANVFW